MRAKMISLVFLLFHVGLVASDCYWNANCVYQKYSSKTPYDAVRGDIRDYNVPTNCEAVSVWSLNRHGNRNPGDSVTADTKAISGLRDQIVASYRAGTSHFCAQDIEDLIQWRWNETLDVSQSFLTGVGYEELYDIAKRLREKYPHLLEGTTDDYYFRTTNEQRTITSAMAFVHGLTETTNLTLPVDGPWDRDDVIRPYENCDRYQKEVKAGPAQVAQMNAYYGSHEYLTVVANVQRRLAITTNLSADDVYSLYELCRFYRSWEPTLKSPWCSVFSIQDLVVLEYHDDVRHYHRNGYGSEVNVNLGGPAVKDLYESIEAAVQGRGKLVKAYFTHDTMIEMTICAMGLFKDDFVIEGDKRKEHRKWRTSEIGCFSSNIMAVLNKCNVQGEEIHRVQLFVNESPTDLCPLEGCSWEQFRNLFQKFQDADLNFCAMEDRTNIPGAASAATTSSFIIAAGLLLTY